ncbi:MAG TPA: DNRLRE domain-containing protein [Frankiaceae bacterium]|nr:DNRLRE domain-containing protein [Frankiaceae bacterium]
MHALRATRLFSRASVVAVATVVGVAGVQPTALAEPPAPVRQSVHRDPDFLEPGRRPENSTITLPGNDRSPARGRAEAAGTDDGGGNGPRWDTHAESRRTKADAEDLARGSGKRVLVTGTLRADSTEYANPDGTTTLELTAGPKRVKRGDGWADIDPTLVRRGNRLAAAAIDGDLTLSAGGDGRLLTLGRGRHSFELGWDGTLPEPRVDGSTATYEGVLPDGDLVVRALRYGFEQSVVLHERPAGPLSYELPLTLPKGQSARQSGGNVALTDADGTVVGMLPQAVMYDGVRDPRADEPANKVLVETTLVRRDDGYAVRYAPDATFLADAVYPVTIDPPATLGIVSDTEVDSGFPDTPYAGSSELRVGTHNLGINKLRSYLTFGTSAIANKTILDADLKIYNFHSWSCSAREMQVFRSTAPTNASTTWTNKPTTSSTVFDAPYPSFAYGYLNTSTCSARMVAIDAKELVQAWADFAQTQSALMLKATSETDNFSWKKFYSGNTGSTTVPTMVVSYNSTPTVSSLSPAAGAVLTDATPNLSGIVGDADGGTVNGQFYIRNSAGTLISNGALRSGSAGSRITYTVESGKLADGQTYTWAMRGCDATECSAATAYRSFTVDLGPPGMPASVTATADDATSTVNWTPPTSDGGAAVTAYHWSLRKADAAETLVAQGTVDDLIRTATVNNLQNGTTYFWRVYAINSVGNGTPRDSADVIPSRRPSAPTTVLATASDQASRVTWEPPASDGGDSVDYYVARLYVKGNTTPIYTSPQILVTATREATKDQLANGTTYVWGVTAYNVRGGDAEGLSNDAVPAGSPTAPRDVDGTEIERPNDVVNDPANPLPTASVTVKWREPENLNGAGILEYQVQAYEMPARTAVYAQPQIACGLCLEKRIDGLKPGRTYVYAVVARNIAGASGEAESPQRTLRLPPQVTKTVTDTATTTHLKDASGRPLAGRGDAVRFTITVKNQQTQDLTITSVTDTLPSGVVAAVATGDDVTVDGASCGSSCALTGQTLTLGGQFTLAPGATRTFSYVAVLTASERNCLLDVVNQATARTPYGLQSAARATNACASALGLEPWWSYVATEVGAQSTASVNVANGNLVVQAVDSTPIQARGRLAYVLRRTYNSQDPASALDLPGSMGAGWSLNLGHSDDAAGGGVTPTGLHVPRIGDLVEELTNPLAVTLVDRDGTRHLFKPKAGLPSVHVSALTGTAAALNPAVLAGPAGTNVCVDLAYQAPAGVHLGLWRYLAVKPAANGPACADDTSDTTSPVVLGYAAMRPDRLRTEYAATGQLLEMRDGAGTTLRYEYEGGAPFGVVTGKLTRVSEPGCTDAVDDSTRCRQFRFAYEGDTAIEVTDSARRVTRYEFGRPAIAGLPLGVRVLHRVKSIVGGVEVERVDYSYQGDSDTAYGPTSCGGSQLQLCSVTDARGKRTTFAYDTSATPLLAGIGRVSGFTDRRLTTTSITYPAADRVVSLRGGQQQRTFDGIDAYGRAARVIDGGTGDATLAGYTALHVTERTWDGTTDCDGGTGPRDNNLCKQVRRGSANTANSGVATPDEVAAWRYNDQGYVLRERRELRPAGAPSATPAYVDATFGYRTQHFGSDSAGNRSTQVATDAVAPLGAVTTTKPAALTGMTTLYAVTDRVESLTPRGNALARTTGESDASYTTRVNRYRTTWTVDSDVSKTPSAPLTAGVCGTNATANTGLVCAETAPYGAESATTSATTRYEYNAFGQKTAKRTPRNGLYEYVYYLPGDKDLSGGVYAAGWLKGVADPARKYVVFGYDRAGNVVRTWDRDATDRLDGDTAPPASSVTAIEAFGLGQAGASEQWFADDTTLAGAAAKPWRYARRQVTAENRATYFDVDAHGNVLTALPPRAAGSWTSPLRTVTTYDAENKPLTIQRGEDFKTGVKTTLVYDAFGNVSKQLDQAGTPTLFTYDLVNRRTKRTFLRGPFPAVAADKPAKCDKSADNDPTFGSNQLICYEITAYDTVDNAVATYDADGQLTKTEFDSLHRRTAQVRPRSATVNPRSAWLYDLDGRVLTACAPRQFENGGTCTATSVNAAHTAYDVAGRAVTTTTYRVASGPITTLTARTTYDEEGNPIAVATPRQDKESGDHTVDQTFDLVGRRTRVDVPRAGSTTTLYTASGDVLAVVAPGGPTDNAGLNGSGRAVRITGHTYDRDHRTLDTVTALQVASANPAGDFATVAAAVASAVTDEQAQTNVRTRSVYDADGNVVARYGPRAFVGKPLTAPDARFMLRADFDDSGRPAKQWSPRSDGTIADDLTDDPTQAAHCPTTGGPTTGLIYPAGTGICTSTMTYDLVGNATQVTLPGASGDQRKLVYAYTKDNLVRETQAPNPAADNTLTKVSEVLHDGSGRPVRSVDAQGRATLTTYLADGLVAKVARLPRSSTDPSGLTQEVSFEYDLNGNPTKETTPRPSSSDAPFTETTYYADNRVQAVHAGGNNGVRGPIQTSYEYDANGNPTAVFSPSANAGDANNKAGIPTRHTYTPDNLVLTTTQPVVVSDTAVVQSRVTTYGYDAAGQKTSVDVDLTGSPAVDGQPQTFTYFPNGLLKKETGRGGSDTTTNAYDATGAVVSAVASDGTTSRSTTVDYYLDGLPRQVVTDGRATAHAFDGTAARTALGEGPAGGALSITRYTLNDAGLPTSMTSPEAGTIGFVYNKLGQPVTETRGARTQVWVYRNDDLLDRTAVASSATLAEQVRSGSVPADLASWSYSYDELGRQLSQSYYGKSASSPIGDVLSSAPVQYSYAYDAAGRLSSFTDARGTRTLTFDHNSNRLKYGDGVQPDATTFTYRADDSISSSTTSTLTRTYAYSQPFGGVTSDGCSTYAYDGLDRLATVTGSGGAGCPTGTVGYAYDAFDRQVRRTAGTTTVRYDYDATSQTVLRQSGDPAGELRFAVDPSGAVKAAKRTAVEHLADDGTGSTGLVTNATGGVACTARYDAFGNSDGNTQVPPTGACNTGSTASDVFYRGNRKDATTGQYQLGSRTYDPAKASFLTPDTYRTGSSEANLGVGIDPLTRNTYSYVNGDPINYVDPSGHEPREVRRNNKRIGWAGNGCSTGDCTPEAAARRDADKRERRVLTQKVEIERHARFQEFLTNVTVGLPTDDTVVHGMRWTSEEKAVLRDAFFASNCAPDDPDREMCLGNTQLTFACQVQGKSGCYEAAMEARAQGETAATVLIFALSMKLGKSIDAAGARLNPVRFAERPGVEVIEQAQLNAGQMANYRRYMSKVPKGGKDSARIMRDSDGNVTYMAEVPATNIPGSYATYIKVVDPSGKTITYVKVTYAPDGRIVHVKPK